MRNKITYEEMVELLRKHTYEAPDNWSAISESLDLSQTIDKLPEYKAPDVLWEGIADALDSTIDTTVDKPAIEVKSYKGYLQLSGLLILILFAIIVYLLCTRSVDSDSEFMYRSEIDVSTSLASDDVVIDDNLNEVYMYIEANEFIFSEEELEKFREHLAELKSAIEAIQKMQENYGQDEHINKLLARIERDKSNLLKEMIAATS